MKKRLSMIVIVIALMICPNTLAAASPPSSLGTQVEAKAEPVYIFSAPAGAEIDYPQTQADLGVFEVNDLFLEDGEWLTLSLIPETMFNLNRPGQTLPYQAVFSPPQALDETNIGQSYGAFIRVDPDALQSAAPGTYRAILRFRITSHPDGITVWEGITPVFVRVGKGQEQSTPSEPEVPSEPASSQVTASSSPSAASKASTPSKTSKPPASSQTSSVTQPQPGQPPDMGTVATIGLPVAATALLMTVLYLVAARIRKRKNTER